MNPLSSQQWLKSLERFLNQERCKWAAPFLAWLCQPLGVLFLVGVSAFLCGLFVAPQGFVVLAAVVAVVVIGCIWPWIGIRGISCELSFSECRAEEGKAVETTLAITNRWPWPVWGLAVEGGFTQIGDAEETKLAVSRIAGWSRGYFHKAFVPTTRGRYPISKPKVVTEFPFGLWKASRPVEVKSSLIVWPERFALPPLALPCGAQSWTGQPSESTSGSIGHRTTVREYRHGDSIRQINWAKTALFDKLVSYEREGLAVSDATISLDTHSSVHRGIGKDSSVEWVIRIAASVCEALVRQGVNVTVISGTSQCQANSSGSSLVMLMDWFAAMEVYGQQDSQHKSYAGHSRWQTGLSIHITTDLSKNFSQDTIVYQTRLPAEKNSTRSFVRGNWITVSKEKDIPNQIRSVWQNGPRSFCHAV